MFGESLEILSLILDGQNKSWEIAQRLEVPIRRYRVIVKRLLELKFVSFDVDEYSYSLTARGENVVKYNQAQILA